MIYYVYLFYLLKLEVFIYCRGTMNLVKKRLKKLLVDVAGKNMGRQLFIIIFQDFTFPKVNLIRQWNILIKPLIFLIG